MNTSTSHTESSEQRTHLLIIIPNLLTSPFFSTPASFFSLPLEVALRFAHGTQNVSFSSPSPASSPTWRSTSQLTPACFLPSSLLPAGSSSFNISVYTLPSPFPTSTSMPSYSLRSQLPPSFPAMSVPAASGGLNCEAKPAPPSVDISSIPWKLAQLSGRLER